MGTQLLRRVALGRHQVITVSTNPGTESLHRAVDQGRAEWGQGVLHMGCGRCVTCDQTIGEQASQGFGEGLVADTADVGAQVTAAASAVAEGGQDHRVPGVGKQIDGRP